MMLEIILTLIFVAVTISVFISNVYSKNNLPPGPTGLPIIGYLHKLGKEALHITLHKLSKKYGDIFSLQLGTHLTVILSSKEAIYEAYVKNAKAISGRPDVPSVKIGLQGKTGLGGTNINEQYRENKKMTVRGFHQFFLNKDLVDLSITKQVHKMKAIFDGFLNKEAFNLIDQFSKLVPAIMLSITFGEEISYDDQDFASIVEANQSSFENSEVGIPIDFFNYRFIQMLPNKTLDIVENSRNKKIMYSMKKINNYLDKKEKTNCLLHSYFENFYRDLSSEKITSEEIHEMGVFVSDLLAGGFDTVATTLSWAVLYLAEYPQVKNRCREEILKVTKEEEISLKDEGFLPYYVATIYDILRLSSVAPLSVSRATVEDVKLRAYDIPKNTMIIPNFWAVNHDPKEWTHPEDLYPQHFLTEDGTIDASAVKKIHVFSLGARKCPGEKLAFYEIYFVLGTIIKTYDLEIVTPPEDMIPKRGLTLKPKNYTVSLNHY